MNTIKAKRNGKKHYTRLTLPDGTYEDFKTVRGAIVFPFRKAPRIILVGGVGKDSGVVKILVEKEFSTLGVAASALSNLETHHKSP